MRQAPPSTSFGHQAPYAQHRTEGTVRVRATRKGFYDNHVKMPGDVFTIQAGEKLGSWMTLDDGDDDGPVVRRTVPSVPPAPQADDVTREHEARAEAAASETKAIDESRAQARAAAVAERDAAVAEETADRDANRKRLPSNASTPTAQDLAREKALIDGKLPDKDRREPDEPVSETGGKKGKSKNDVL